MTNQALGFVQIPAEVSKTLLSIPSKTLVFRYQDMNTDKELIKTRKAVADTQNELINTQQKLEEANKAALEKQQQ